MSFQDHRSMINIYDKFSFRNNYLKTLYFMDSLFSLLYSEDEVGSCDMVPGQRKGMMDTLGRVLRVVYGIFLFELLPSSIIFSIILFQPSVVAMKPS